MSVAFVDTETAGLDPDLNPVWEIAVILPNGPDEGEHCWQVQVPELPVIAEGRVPPADRPWMSQWVLDNTGFAQRYDRDTALTPLDAIQRFAELVDGRHLVGAVPSFDEERLRGLYRTWINPAATQFLWNYHLIDVEAMAVGALTAVGHQVELPWNSDALGARLGVQAGPNRHTALADAEWAKAIYEACGGPL